MVATILAKLEVKHFVGFIDADNFMPGTVHKYYKSSRQVCVTPVLIIEPCFLKVSVLMRFR